MATTYSTYRARDKTGKVTEGEIEGSSKEAVVKALRENGARAAGGRTRSRTTGFKTGDQHPGSQRPDQVEGRLGLQPPVRHHDQRRPVAAAVACRCSRSRLESKPLAKIIGEVRRDVERGVGLSTALEKHPKAFGKLYTVDGASR